MTNKIKASNLDTNAVTADSISYPLTTFSSTGIDDNATSTAITIDSSQNVGVGTTSPNTLLHLKSNNAEILFEDSSPDDAREAKISTNAGDLIFQVGDDLTGTPTVDGQLTMFDGGSLIYSQSGTNRFNINTSGNVGIGTTTIPEVLTANKSSNGAITGLSINNDYPTTSTASAGTGSGIRFGVNDGNFNSAFGDGRGSEILSVTTSTNGRSRDIVFKTDSGGTLGEVMRIDSSGRLLVNGTTAEGTAKLQSHLGTSGYCSAMYSIQNQADYIEFLNDGGQVGSIRRSGGTGVSYNTTSDYRLKENVSYDFDATTRLKQLKPARFNFIADANTTVDGFLAHEVSSIVPEAISGTKDEVQVWKEGEELPEGVSVGDNKLDGEGNTIPMYQGIDQSKLVPILTKALQEAITKIETLEARITALETT